MKIYTRRGDKGETDLFGGARVAKDHPRVEAYGAVDELNSCIGNAMAHSTQEDLRTLAQRIQSTLLDLGAHLATPDEHRRQKANIPEATPEDITELESQIDRLEGELEPLTTFILPGGSAAAGGLHHARTVCRRAERASVSLAREEPVDETALRYLNRLSDLLFVMARAENHRAGIADIPWTPRER